VLIFYLEANSGARRSEKHVVEGSKYARWIGLYLSFHLNWVLGSFVHGRLQYLQTSEVTFAHVITPLIFFKAMLNCQFMLSQRCDGMRGGVLGWLVSGE